jgi:Phosphatidylglycerol lysyltransferase, C-terminal
LRLTLFVFCLPRRTLFDVLAIYLPLAFLSSKLVIFLIIMSLSGAEAVAQRTPETKPKKQRQLQTKPAEEKLTERLSRELTNELGKITHCDDFSDLLETLTCARYGVASTTTTSTTPTSTFTTTTVAELTKTASGGSSGRESQETKANYEEGRVMFTLDTISASKENRTIQAKYKKGGSIFTLEEFSAVAALEALIDQFGRVSHMGILDRSYSFFVTNKRDAALCFKVKDKVAVVGGDPLCDQSNFDRILAEFAEYRKIFSWGIAFLGATSEFATYAQSKRWVTMQFGIERVLNPMTNPLLLETKGGKRMISQSKQLLRSGITLGIYSPKHSFDFVLENQLVHIYDTWRSQRNRKPSLQVYMTIYDPFAMREIMTYVYVKDASGEPCGFAALRKIVGGYHIDPSIARPGSSRGVSELLIISAMSLLQKAEVSYLSLGFEPSTELGEITGMAKPVQSVTRLIHRHTYRDLPIGKKRDFHDKFRPDEEQETNLYLVFPGRTIPGLLNMKAMMHIVNIDISKLITEAMNRAIPWHFGQ